MWWGVAVEAPDPAALGAFYARLLGWPVVQEAPGTVVLAPPGGPTFAVFQQAADFEAPRWPPTPGAQRPMMHLDFQVDRLDAAVAEAVELGATLSGYQPNENVRVLIDPAGHPFCLCLDEG